MGTPLSRVERDRRVYTLYGPNEPFIRVLDTENRTVRRISLPGLVPADVTSMLLQLDGDTLRVRSRLDAPIRLGPPRWTAFCATVTA